LVAQPARKRTRSFLAKGPQKESKKGKGWKQAKGKAQSRKGDAGGLKTKHRTLFTKRTNTKNYKVHGTRER